MEVFTVSDPRASHSIALSYIRNIQGGCEDTRTQILTTHRELEEEVTLSAQALS